MRLTTDAIDESGFLDARYTCDIDNSSPELRWEEPPTGAAGFVLIAEDLDAPGGVFSHWVVYNIPKELSHLPAGIPPQDTLPNGIKQGVNSFGKLGYGGPCPPHGHGPHRYVFRLFALSHLPEFSPRASREEVLASIKHFMLAEAEVVGRYQRMLERAG